MQLLFVEEERQEAFLSDVGGFWDSDWTFFKSSQDV